eukprot:gene17226-18947_t
MQTVSVPIYSQPINEDNFIKDVHSKRKPTVLKDLEFGEAKRLWTADYLEKSVGSCPVKVHVAPTSSMNFLKKNFQYKAMPFDEFISRARQVKQTDYFLCPDEKYYLRSIASRNPRKDVADIHKDFPQIAGDLNLPSFISEDKFFSSVLRIGSANLQLWTHYDVMDNVLIQVAGRKRVVLFCPKDASNLYLCGDKSEIMDIDNPDFNKYPKFKNVVKQECILEQGDALFIPALWFHNVIPQEFSVSINIFWRHLDQSSYDKKDIYGNKDPQHASNAMQLLEKGVKLLDELPEDYKDFYARLMVSRLESKCFQQN